MNSSLPPVLCLPLRACPLKILKKSGSQKQMGRHIFNLSFIRDRSQSCFFSNNNGIAIDLRLLIINHQEIFFQISTQPMKHKLDASHCEPFPLTFKPNTVYQGRLTFLLCDIPGKKKVAGYICIERVIFLFYSLFHTNCISSKTLYRLL